MTTPHRFQNMLQSLKSLRDNDGADKFEESLPSYRSGDRLDRLGVSAASLHTKLSFIDPERCFIRGKR